MYTKKELEHDLSILNIGSTEELSVKYVTLRYKRVAKEKHPDKGGEKDLFQELQAAYKRVVEHLELNKPETVDTDYEKEFFVKNNIMKECTKSFVIYIQEDLLSYWKMVFKKHLKVHRSSDNGSTIFKTGAVTLTLYEKPKVDPRSKIHIQGKDQALNLEFILEKLSLFFREACSLREQKVLSIQNTETSEKVMCSQCGKQYISKKGLKTHLLRINAGEAPKRSDNPIVVESAITSSSDTTEITLEEDIENPPSQMSDMIIDAVFTEINKQAESQQITNFQCGDCGDVFKSTNEVRNHVVQVHDEVAQSTNGSNTPVDVPVESIAPLQDLKLENKKLVVKSESLDKEVKRMRLAFTESEYGTSEIMKELKTLREKVVLITRENEILKEQVRVKADTIQLLKDGTRSTSNNHNLPNINHDIEVYECTQCDYTSSDKKSLEVHSASHETKAKLDSTMFLL